MKLPRLSQQQIKEKRIRELRRVIRKQRDASTRKIWKEHLNFLLNE